MYGLNFERSPWIADRQGAPILVGVQEGILGKNALGASLLITKLLVVVSLHAV
jgi:hypothetical protein